MAGKFGGKRVLGLGVLITALATVLMPTAARWDYRAVYVLRALMGLAEVKMFEVGEGVGNTYLLTFSTAVENSQLPSRQCDHSSVLQLHQ